MKNIRWYLFWINDFIHGAKIRKAYNDIKKMYYEYDEKLVEKQLKVLLKQVTKDSKFYNNYRDKDILNFPIMNKTKIIENLEDIRVNIYNEEKLHTMCTSGSTGTPFIIKQNKEKRRRVIAEVIFFGQIAGYTFGQRQINLRVWTDKNRKGKIQKNLQNMITKDISNLNEKNLYEIAEILKNDKKIKNILSYASSLDVISKYMLKNGYQDYKYSLTSIISGAESLQDNTRENLRKIFDCNIVSRYSNQENGIIAQEDIKNRGFYINRANYYIEFLKLDQDVPAKNGELSRIVITDLYNYVQPMIRYDTGDIAIVDEVEGKIVLKEIYGRRVDLIYNTKGQTLSPHSITNNMWGIEGIKQFKFIQEGSKDYTIELNAKNDQEKEQNIIKKFKVILGNDAKIKIKYVEELPVLNSGKRKYIENRCKLEVKNK